MSERAFITDRASRESDGTVKLRLRAPIDVEGKTVGELTFRTLRVKHLLVLDTISGPRHRVVHMIQSSAKIPAPAIDEMTGADFLDCDEIVSDFLDRPSLLAEPSAASSRSPSAGRHGSSDG